MNASEPRPTTSGESRIAIRVTPGASRTRVGGQYGGSAAEPGHTPGRPGTARLGVLLVAVRERAVDGKATAAALAALAKAIGVPPRTVRLVSGATGRDKVVAIADPPPDLADRVDALRNGPV